WMSPLSSEEFVRLASRYTVARMLERDDFSNRMKNNQPISIHEFLYPLVQGYDSVALKADVELGGTDQKFNLIVGRELQKEYAQKPQVVLTMPILEGLDGVQKMSKSLNNYVGIKDPPQEMFGKIMSITDELMYRYYELCTDLSLTEIHQLRQDVLSGTKHPRSVKAQLAKRIIQDFHSREAAEIAEQEFNRIFQQKLDPDDIEEKKIRLGSEKIRLTKLIVKWGMAPSVAEANRLIQQGGVTWNNSRISNIKAELDCSVEATHVIKVGKRRFVKVVVESNPSPLS
ncbi:MAG: tyrosine--tRNA ligase, partial [Terriglobia bacterium]